MFANLADHLSDFPNKLNLFVAFAPAIYVHDDASEIWKKIVQFLDPTELKLLGYLGIYELFGPDWDAVTSKVCPYIPSWCENHGVVRVAPGPNVDPVAANFSNARTHSGISVKQAIHYE